MEYPNLKQIETFDIDTLPDLDVCVLSALELFMREGLPEMNILKYNKPLVAGSGNAAATGKIIMSDTDAIFADESSFKQKLEAIRDIDGVMILSASGGKHAPIIAKEAKVHGKDAVLLTCNPNAEAKEFVASDKVFVFPKQREPYTYNTSTYLGMILAKSKESPEKIYEFIKQNIDPLITQDIGDYDAYYVMVPEEFDEIREMLTTKFVELFGRRLARDVFTFEQSKHAKTVVNADKELFISFGKKNDFLGENRVDFPLPEDAGYGAMLAISYYVVGKIQKKKPAWFKENIAAYCKKASGLFGQDIKPIVE